MAVAAVLVLVLVGAACGSDDPGDPVAAFDGTTCSYTGPTNFELNTLPKFTVINDSEEPFALMVFHVGASVDRDTAIEAANAYVTVEELPAGVTGGIVSGIVDAGLQPQVNVSFTAEGEYLLACGTFPLEPEDRKAIPFSEVLTVG